MKLRQNIMVSLLVLVIGLPAGAGAQQRTKIRYALGDILSVESLPLLIAVERLKQRGVDVEITSFKSEDLATQAVVNGQSDIGQGAPYAVIEKLGAPIRLFYQLNALQFFPVVNKDHYKDWKDLNGQEIVVHSRGSGTEAIMRLMEKHHGIKYKNLSYVPGSEVRALGMLKGNIKATIVDAANKNYLMKEGADKFLILPLGEVKASDEALFATRAFLDANETAVTTFLEELIKVYRAINADPQFPAKEREKLGLLKDLPAKLESEIEPYFKEAVEGGIFPSDGGGERAAKNDLEFYSLSGKIQKKDAKVEDFWHLAPLKRALANVR